MGGSPEPPGGLLADLRRLVEAESPSSDRAAVRGCAEVLAGILADRLGADASIGGDGRVTWRSAGAGPGVLLLGHLDTVWPVGTLARRPFRVGEARITGPGVFDMKGGLTVVVHALARLRAAGRLPGVELLVTTDEELGSPRSAGAVAAAARRCGRVLVAEPCGPGGAVKTGRKGVALGEVVVHGRAAHSGLEPHAGINAGVILGGLLERITQLGDPERATTVTPTLVRAGSAANAVPARASARVDVRFFEEAEVDRVAAGLAALPVPEGAELVVDVDVNRPAMTPAASAPLRGALEAAARAAGQTVATVTVGGASDGNLAAAAGAAVLDGLGPEGGGAHAADEHVTPGGLVRRVALLEALIARVAEPPADGRPQPGTGPS